MFAEASSCMGTIKHDQTLHIQGGLSNKVYTGGYNDINLSFSESEAKQMNSYAAIAEAHGEGELATKILNTFLMPFSDEDTVSVSLLNLDSLV